MGLYYFDIVWLSLSSMSNFEREIVSSTEDYCNPIICFSWTILQEPNAGLGVSFQVPNLGIKRGLILDPPYHIHFLSPLLVP